MGGSVTLDDASAPWPAPARDRLMTAAQFGHIMASWVEQGVVRNVNGELEVSATSPAGLTVNVASGNFIGGLTNLVFALNAATRTLLITAATGSARIDNVVAEIDTTNRLAYLKVIDGRPASSPSAPALVKTAAIYQILLATVRVAARASSISNSNITNSLTRFSIPRNSGAATVGNVIASGFNGNLTTSDDTLQEIAQKFNDFEPLFNEQTFAASGVWVKFAGSTFTLVEVLGAGSGGTGGHIGGGNRGTSGGNGGGGGGYVQEIFLSGSIPDSVAVTIGAGGAGGRGGLNHTATAGLLGGTGGNSSFGSLVIAGGGPGGYAYDVRGNKTVYENIYRGRVAGNGLSSLFGGASGGKGGSGNEPPLSGGAGGSRQSSVNNDAGNGGSAGGTDDSSAGVGGSGLAGQGGGGGGGAHHTTSGPAAHGADGGNGAPACGGGGGGAVNVDFQYGGSTGGDGGDGGNGFMRIVSW